MELMLARVDPDRVDAPLLFGFVLARIIFGTQNYTIKNLNLILRPREQEFIPLYARLVAPTLTTLELIVAQSSVTYSVLDTFFIQYPNLRYLRVYGLDFGQVTSPDSITPTTRDGLARLNQLDLNSSFGKECVFVEMCALKSFSFTSHKLYSKVVDTLSAVANNLSSSLVSLKISIQFGSFALLHEILKSARNLQNLLETLARLPHLTVLYVSENPISAAPDYRGTIIASLIRCPSSRALTALPCPSLRNKRPKRVSPRTPYMLSISQRIRNIQNISFIISASFTRSLGRGIPYSAVRG